MSGWKKLASAAAAAGGGLNVEDVFSTYLYTGTGAAQTITNGLDLANEGGLVWHKARESASNNDHSLFDSETSTGSTFPSIQKAWESNVAGNLATRTAWTFNSDGFTTTASDGSNGTDQNGIDYVTWSFRKCPKFFDVVNYTGNGTSGRTISHNLGVVPAMIIVLGQGTGDYWVYHKDVGNTKYLELNKTTAAQTNSSAWNNTTPTDSVFTVGNGVPVNYNNIQYTAYLFAHNDGDGNFGPTGDQDIIKCGSYTGSNSQELNIGFEPQWILIKRTDVAEDWILFDNMRGMSDRNNGHLEPNRSNAEQTSTLGSVLPTPQGIQFDANTMGEINSGGDDFIYIAIRRGPMAVPESATDVFAIDTYGGTLPNPPTYNSGFEVDMALARDVNSNDNWELCTRLLQGSALRTNLTNAQDTGVGAAQFDFMDGWRTSSGTSTDYYSWMWRRAPNFFDVVTYTGAYSASGLTINHNLGVVPEMIWVKSRNATGNWYVYHANVSADPETDYLVLNEDNDVGDNIYWNDTAPTDTQFFVNAQANSNGDTYIACLFASLDGISKVGSYTGNGSSQTIDCGFSNGARFVLIKRTDISRDWYLWDSERGIVSGNDPHLSLNTTASEVTTNDSIDPASSGFVVNQVGTLPGINVSSGSYVFYAIA